LKVGLIRRTLGFPLFILISFIFFIFCLSSKDSNYVFMTQPFRDTETKRAENISLKYLSVNHLQAFLGFL
jgi:hypothetical protein